MAFPIQLQLTYGGRVIRSEKDRPEFVTIRQWRAVAKASFGAMGAYWHEHFLPLHFGSNAARRYSADVVQSRSIKWLSRKLGVYRADVEKIAGVNIGDTREQKAFKRMVARQKLVAAAGGQNYNVFTGTLREMVLGTLYVRAFPSRFSLEMPVPSYLPTRRKEKTHPDQRAELTAILPSETDAMNKVGQRVLISAMQSLMQTGSLPEGV